jgi:hypothetical protein
MKIVWIFSINKLLIWLIIVWVICLDVLLGRNLLAIEFAHNYFVDRSISKILFKIVHGYSPFPPDICTFAFAESFAQQIHGLCAVIRWKIALSIENYKLSFDTHCRNK